MSLITVDEALRNVLATIGAPLEPERVPLAQAGGRILTEDVAARRDQPPFAASAMDGYAARHADLKHIPATLRLIGVSAAGRRFTGRVGAGEAVRISTGAPVPEGADCVVIQENAAFRDGAVIVNEAPMPGRHIRPSGLDFKAGESGLASGRMLDAKDIALAAAMGYGALTVRRKPRVAILATGNELVPAGEAPGADQIVAASLPALLAMVGKAGAEAIDLGIARDSLDSLTERVAAAKSAQADLLVTLGGASVGDHDLVQEALTGQGMALGFWRVALRPGKPLMHGTLDGMTLLGLPGNPVSSIVCAILFLIPAIRALQGHPDAGGDPTEAAILGVGLGPNGDRQDYMRATLSIGERGPVVTPHPIQDSSMLLVLARSDALLVRAPMEAAQEVGSPCRIIKLSRFC
jgi:molybdopterin molybdotransferase